VLNGHWHWPSLPTADAFRDDKSDVEAMRAGLTTRTAIIAKNGDGTFEDVLARGTQEAIAIEMATQDANRELVRRGYKPTVADLNIAQDTANPTQQPEPAPEANKPQGEAPANATAALAFDESKHPRADDGKFGSGGGGAKKEATEPAKKEAASPSETGEKTAGKTTQEGENRFNQKILTTSHLSGKSEGEKWDNDMQRFISAARNGDADFPPSADDPGSANYLHWEAGFLGLDKPRYVQAIRIGEIPIDGRSFNFSEQKFERGVSALNVEGEKRSDVGTYDLFNDGKRILIEGYLHHHKGSDGEPLIVGAKKVKDLND
jgi:hypothetical protein